MYARRVNKRLRFAFVGKGEWGEMPRESVTVMLF